MANPSMWDGSGFKQPRAEKKPAPKSRRRAAVRKVSDKQAKRTCFLHGIKAQRLYEQERACERFYCEGDCDYLTVSWEEAWNELTLHHTVKRSKGHGYIDYADFGVDEPRLLILLCKVCHQAVESNPQFGKASA